MEKQTENKKKKVLITIIVISLLVLVSFAVLYDLGIINLQKYGVSSEKIDLNQTYWNGFNNGSNSAFYYINSYLINNLQINYEKTNEYKVLMPIYLDNQQLNLTCRIE